MIAYYDPFEKWSLDNTVKWGAMKWIPTADIDDWILQKGSDFKGSPFRASIFI